MSLESAFAPAEALYRAQVNYQTYGHLYPKTKKKYRGFIEFGRGGYTRGRMLNATFEDLGDRRKNGRKLSAVQHQV